MILVNHGGTQTYTGACKLLGPFVLSLAGEITVYSNRRVLTSESRLQIVSGPSRIVTII